MEVFQKKTRYIGLGNYLQLTREELKFIKGELLNEEKTQTLPYVQQLEIAKIVISLTSHSAAQWYIPTLIDYLLRCEQKCRDLSIADDWLSKDRFGNIEKYKKEWFDQKIGDFLGGRTEEIFIRIFIYDQIYAHGDICLKTIQSIHTKLNIPYLFIHKDHVIDKFKRSSDDVKKSLINVLKWQLGIKNNDNHPLQKQINQYLKKTERQDAFLDYAMFFNVNGYNHVWYQNETEQFQTGSTSDHEIIIKNILECVKNEWSDSVYH